MDPGSMQGHRQVGLITTGFLLSLTMLIFESVQVVDLHGTSLRVRIQDEEVLWEHLPFPTQVRFMSSRERIPSLICEPTIGFDAPFRGGKTESQH